MLGQDEVHASWTCIPRNWAISLTHLCQGCGVLICLGLIALTPWGNSGKDLRSQLVRMSISTFKRSAYGAAAFTCMSAPRGCYYFAASPAVNLGRTSSASYNMWVLRHANAVDDIREANPRFPRLGKTPARVACKLALETQRDRWQKLVIGMAACKCHRSRLEVQFFSQFDCGLI
jgi:hypothetical protein